MSWISHDLLCMIALCSTAAVPRELAAQPADSVARGRAILQRAQRAMGGAENLVAAKDVTHVMEIALEPALGGFVFKQVSRFVAPDHLRHEQEMPFGKVTIYSNGKTGWAATPQGVEPLSAALVQQSQGVLFRQPTALMVSDRDRSRRVYAVGDFAVAIETQDGQKVRVEFDSATGLPSRQLYTEPSPNGAVEREEIFSDWRQVDGIKMAYKAVQLEQGTKRLVVTISEYRINRGLTGKELSAKP